MLGVSASDVKKFMDATKKLAGFAEKFITQAGPKLAGAAGSAIGGVAAPLGGIDKIVTPITQAFSGIVDKIMGVAGPLISMVDKMNPAVVQLFEFAINDMMAVFGDILQPILVAITGITRQLADTFKTMKPAIDPIISAVVKMIAVFGKMIVPLAQVFTPILGIIGNILEQLVLPMLEKFAVVLQYVAKATVWSINVMIDVFNELKKFSNIIMLVSPALGMLLKALNLQKVNFNDLKKESSVGESIRQTSRMSGVDLGKRTREGAFGQVAWQNKMLGRLDEMIKVFTGIPGAYLVPIRDYLQNLKDQMIKQAGQQNAG